MRNTYPYTDYHELNADHILKQLAKLTKLVNSLPVTDDIQRQIDQINLALLDKVDKIDGKGLSSNDFTDADVSKLSGIAAGAEVNVQADWDEEDASSDAYIQNKPYIPAPIITSSSGSIASFPDGAPAPVIGLTADINAVQSGSGDPSPVNIRPISGWNAVNVVACGINIWDENWELGGYNTSGNPTTSSTAIRSASNDYIPILPSTTYYAKTSGQNLHYCQYTEDKTFISRTSVNNATFTTDANARYIRFNMATAYGTTYNNDISINYPSTDTDYHAYTGTTTTISLGSTIYGGTLDVTNGVLTVTHGYVDLGSLTWAYNGNAFDNMREFAVVLTGKANGILNMMCSTLTVKSASGASGYQCIRGRAANATISVVWDDMTIANFTTAMSGVQLVYELATPQTITLTPTEVTTLLGDNNIWADSGNVSVTYIADTKLYIDKLI